LGDKGISLWCRKRKSHEDYIFPQVRFLAQFVKMHPCKRKKKKKYPRLHTYIIKIWDRCRSNNMVF
jgi:hypothetical protein